MDGARRALRPAGSLLQLLSVGLVHRVVSSGAKLPLCGRDGSSTQPDISRNFAPHERQSDRVQRRQHDTSQRERTSPDKRWTGRRSLPHVVSTERLHIHLYCGKRRNPKSGGPEPSIPTPRSSKSSRGDQLLRRTNRHLGRLRRFTGNYSNQNVRSGRYAVGARVRAQPGFVADCASPKFTLAWLLRDCSDCQEGVAI